MKSSELITNADGSIYHLKLHKKDIASTIITVGDPGRVELIAGRLDSVRVQKQNREFCTVTGPLGTKELTIISTGIGTDNVDIVLNELQMVHACDLQTGHFRKDEKPLTIIRLGTSGAIQPSVPVDSVLISHSALGYDGLLHFYENDQKVTPGFLSEDLDLPAPYHAWPDERLYQKFKPMADEKGITLTAPGFYGPQGRQVLAPLREKELLKKWGRLRAGGEPLTNLEMETAGIYGLGKLLGMHTISFSALLANRANGTFSQNPEATINTMIARALEIISELH